jgi:transglutaminase-like putative cysteine protease
VRLLLAFIAFFGVLADYRTINGVEAGSALLVVMVALKFLESQQHRDQLVLMIIAYFLMFAGLLTERSPLTAVYLFALVWLTTIGLLQLGRRGPLLPSAATAKLAARLLVHAVPVMVVLFVLFPRLPGPLWAIPGNTSSAASGLSDSMSPGDITELGLSDEAAFRVEFDAATPTADKLYWRGPVLSNFDGRKWSRAEGMRRNVADTIEHLGIGVDYRVMLEPSSRRWAFALDMPQRWSTDRNLRMGSDYQLAAFFGGPQNTRLDYRVTSHTEYRAREPLNEDEQDLFRRLPEGSSPRTRALVATWLTDQPAAEQIIERSLNFLRAEQFFYTLTPPPLGAEPVDEFLFATREGFCEHYASAFAVMMRAAGLPARVVTGYQGGELNSVGEYYIVRQSDAHAWTEVWLGDRGWVRVDPIVAVAPERIALGSSRGSLAGAVAPGRALARIAWVRQALLVWDAAQTYWDDWVLGYGFSAQRALLESFGITNLRRAQRWAMLLALTVSATVVALLGLSLYLAWRYRRRRRDPAARCFERFSRTLSRLAVAPRAPHEGPEAYARRAQQALPGAAEAIAAIVAAYLQARYEPDANRTALASLRRRVAAFRAT